MKVIFVRGGGNEVVVQVHEDCRLSGESAVRQLLEGLGGVFEAEGHEEVLENKPKGVMIAVLGTLAVATGTWWYPFTRSSLLNTLQPARRLLRSCMLGKGYLSGVVMLLRRW